MYIFLIHVFLGKILFSDHKKESGTGHSTQSSSHEVIIINGFIYLVVICLVTYIWSCTKLV